MRTRLSGFSPGADLRVRAYDGIVTDLWTVGCAASAGGEYVARDPRIVVILEGAGHGDIAVDLPTGGRKSRPGNAVTVSYIPADYPIRAEITGLARLRHLDIHFDPTALARRCPNVLDRTRLETPRVLVTNERVASLAGLIAADCASDAPRHALFGESLTLALITETLEIDAPADKGGAPLRPAALRRVIAHLEAHATETVRVRDLADLVGLSESHFCRNFKAATGLTPHRWQMRARIEKAQALLTERPCLLTDVAAATGFADHSHFSRVFRKMTGTSPSAWLASRGG
ncbi:AraC family transcriptional regulator [Chthonobacter rhizosphaerae]|uniref:AraC family transcriptional regulator n=1 Tax=Chthonobacter rhizosphaerae TaxID=2735553 RepID=UPI0015EF9F5A|nr:AraC family transcriptional regulator [Chthonobacter rhizosphaerae]